MRSVASPLVSRGARLLAILVVAGVALGVHAQAIDRLPIDFDEDDYLRAGQLYADAWRKGDLSVVFRENYRTEHPPLTKLVVGLGLLALPEVPEIPDRPTTAPPAESLPEPHLTVGRWLNATPAIVTTAALAALNPLAGLFLAVDTWQTKYTSQVMLEALPAALSLLAVLAYMRASRVGVGGAPLASIALLVRKYASSRRRTAWLVASAVLFGLACAGKYTYGLAGVAIALDWLVRRRASEGLRASIGAAWRPLAGWAALAFVVFLLADPYLWPDPIGRLSASLAFHGGYAGTEAVTQTGWPFWQPIVWLLGSVPFHEPGTFPLAIDLLVTVLAGIGLRRLWARQRVMAIWLLVTLAFLLVWPTKWPQYLLLMTAPVALAASHGAWLAVVEPVRGRLARWYDAGRRDGWRPRLGARARAQGGFRSLVAASPWLVPGAVALTVLGALPMLYQLAMALTDFSRASTRDGINGGVLREAVGGLSGAIPAAQVNIDRLGDQVHYVGFDLIGGFANGFWLGSNTSAEFLGFSLVWTVLVLALQTTLGLAIALLLARPGVRFVAAWRVLFIIPWAVPEFVGAIAWRNLVEPERGSLALLLGTEIDWGSGPNTALPVLLAAGAWMGFPLMMLVATAGLRTIPPSVLEAADLDGAGRWTRFRRVTLPLLVPLLAPALVIRGIAAFEQFYLFYVLFPPEATTTVTTFSYFVLHPSEGAGLFSVSAAINVVTAVALAIVAAWFLRWRAREERVAFA